MLYKLKQLELTFSFNSESITAFESIRSLLTKVDFSVEFIPTEETNKLEDLLTHLKGNELTEYELLIVEKLIDLLSGFDGIANDNKDLDKFIATLNKHITATEVNKFLFKNGIVLIHLVKRKPSLEQQLLTLTNN